MPAKGGWSDQVQFKIRLAPIDNRQDGSQFSRGAARSGDSSEIIPCWQCAGFESGNDLLIGIHFHSSCGNWFAVAANQFHFGARHKASSPDGQGGVHSGAGLGGGDGLNNQFAVAGTDGEIA